jgi:hypothetical protein
MDKQVDKDFHLCLLNNHVGWTCGSAVERLPGSRAWVSAQHHKKKE